MKLPSSIPYRTLAVAAIAILAIVGWFCFKPCELRVFCGSTKECYWFWPTMNGIFVAVGAGYICDSAVASGASAKETIEEMK